MSKFSQIANGAAGIDSVEIPMIGVEKPVKIGLRVLLSDADDDILKNARAFAIAQGVEDPKDGNPIYDLARARETIALACVDLDSPAQGERFFENAAEVRTGLDRDRIAYLYERQQRWQDACSPSRKKMGDSEFVAKIIEIAEAGDDDPRPFDELRPILLESYTRILSREFVILAKLKSLSGSDWNYSSKPSTKSTEAAES